MQHGHPQLTIADLLGNPLPADLVGAQRMEDIRITWRSWLGMRVKIIDEYNRIPTRTQSAADRDHRPSLARTRSGQRVDRLTPTRQRRFGSRRMPL